MTDERAAPSPLLASLVIAFAAVCLAGFLWAAVDRMAFLGRHPLAALLASLGLFVLTVGPIVKPVWGAYLVLLIIPLFGNHPGGRFMEIINIPVAAGAIGFAAHAWRSRLPPPAGILWRAAGLYLVTAVLALIPTLPAIAVRWFEINNFPIFIVQTLTATEHDPLYSLSSIVLLALPIAWAMGLAWTVDDVVVARRMLQSIMVGLLGTVLFGILDFHGVVDLKSRYFRLIDDRFYDFGGFQGTFWNPGWFAWYFTIAFGIAIGVLCGTTGWKRWLCGSALAVAYLYFWANRQRAGVVVLHVMLLAFVGYLGWRRRRRALWMACLAVPVVLLVVALAPSSHLLVQRVPDPWFSGVKRLAAQPTDVFRRNIGFTALEMWNTARLFGIGEAAFGWRYREFVAVGSPIETETWGDAHSTWLQLLATRGLAGVAAYLVLLGAAAWRITLLLRQVDRTRRDIGLGLLLGMIAIVTYSFVQHLYYIQGTQIFFWALIAIASVAWPRSAITSPAALRVSWLAPLVLSAAVVFQLASSLPLIRRAAADIARLPRGFHGIEHWQPTGETMRWSLRQGILCLYPTSPVIALKLLTANPAVVGNPITVTLWADHRVLDRIEIASTQPVVRSLRLMEWSGGATPESTGQAHFGECRPGRKPLRLTVDVSRVWSPLSIRTGHDARHLGVAVFQPSFSGVSP